MCKPIYLIISSAIAVLIILINQFHAQSIIGFNDRSPTQKPLPLDQYTGVAYITVNDSPCTGSLLKGDRFVLTAAHCLTEDSTPVPENTVGNVTFKVSDGIVTIPISNYFIHPNWHGYSIEEGNDIALLKLADPAPSEIEQYDIYRNFDEVGKTFIKVGYGYIGSGKKGQDEESNAEALRYAGQNTYDSLVDVFQTVNSLYDFSELVLGSQLLFDFDNGKKKNDVLGLHFPFLADRGLGKNEIGSGNGDSGGPSFINGKIAGITSWGSGDGDFFEDELADIDDNSDNGSFGEFFGDTRVSFYADWIDSIIGDGEEQPRQGFKEK